MKNGVLQILRSKKLKYEKEGVRKIAVLETWRKSQSRDSEKIWCLTLSKKSSCCTQRIPPHSCLEDFFIFVLRKFFLCWTQQKQPFHTYEIFTFPHFNFLSPFHTQKIFSFCTCENLFHHTQKNSPFLHLVNFSLLDL